MTWTGRPSIPAGKKILASDFTAIMDQIDQLTAPGWTSFTPGWTSSGTTPAIGNGSINGYYRRPAGSDLIEVRGILTWGSSTTPGTGIWRLGLPVNAATNEVGRSAGAAYVLDSGTQRWAAAAYIQTASYLHIVNGAGGDVGLGVPMTWAVNDVLAWRAVYEPA